MTNKEVINFLNQVRKILLDDKSWLESTIQPINEAFDMAINALTAQPEETHDKRTETHACDLIDRQAAIDAMCELMHHWFGGDPKDEIREIKRELEKLPSAQPEIIHCKDCKFWREHKYAKETKRYIPFCGFNAIYTKSDDFCSRAERRTDG